MMENIHCMGTYPGCLQTLRQICEDTPEVCACGWRIGQIWNEEDGGYICCVVK